MGLFSKSKLNSDEYEILHKKIISVAGDLDLINARISGINSALASLRSSFNQHKIKDKVAEVEEQEDPEIETNKNPEVFLNPYGHPLKTKK